MSLKSLSNKELIEQLKQLIAKEKECTYNIVLHLAEVDDRRLYAELGYCSLFDYATNGLGYSRMSAQRRIVAARILRQAPESYELLKSGEITLSHFEALNPAIDENNASELICAVAGQCVEVARITAVLHSRRPAPVADRIEPVVCSVAADKAQPDFFRTTEPTAQLDELKYRISFTASPELKNKLEQVEKLIFGHSAAGIEDVLEEVLDFYVKRCSAKERQKRRNDRKPKPEPFNAVALFNEALESKSRTAPLVLRDQILERDGYRCVYVSPDGIRCGCEVKLEIDHIIPWARGGKTCASNLRTMCRAHNQLVARQIFGERVVERNSSYSHVGVS